MKTQIQPVLADPGETTVDWSKRNLRSYTITMTETVEAQSEDEALSTFRGLVAATADLPTMVVTPVDVVDG